MATKKVEINTTTEVYIGGEKVEDCLSSVCDLAHLAHSEVWRYREEHNLPASELAGIEYWLLRILEKIEG